MTSMTKIRVSHDDFDVSEEIAALEREGRNAGAVVTFTGVVRSDDGVTAMHLEHYPDCLLYTSPSPRDPKTSRMPSSA